MKIYIISAVLVFLASIVHAFSVQSSDGRISINKYYIVLNRVEVPVWDDSEKEKMLKSSVDTGTGTIKDSDFILVVLTDEDKKVIKEVQGTASASEAKDRILKKLGR